MSVEYLDLADYINWQWSPKPDIDAAEKAVLAIASGEWDERSTASWLKKHLRPVVTDD